MKFYFSLIAIITVMIISSSFMFAEIVYTDISPDTIIEPAEMGGMSYRVDLNGDNVDDFYISVNNNYEFSNVCISGINKLNQVVGNGDTTQCEKFFPLQLNYNEEVSFSMNDIWYNSWDNEWNHDIPMPIAGYGISEQGNWTDFENEHYLGVRLFISGNFYYGWIGIKLTEEHNKCTITSFAFESEPNKIVYAGADNGTNVIENRISDFELYPIPSKDKLNITSTLLDMQNYHVEIYSTDGSQIINDNYINNNHHIAINLNNIEPGFYFLIIDDGENIQIAKKIIIEK